MVENSEDVKQVVLLRKDLGMKKGKLVAQGGHGSLGALLDSAKMEVNEAEDKLTLTITNKDVIAWLLGRFTKVALGVDTVEELVALYEKAKSLGVPCSLIQDAGFTVFHGVPTLTCVGLGPAKREVLDSITKHLKLL